MLKCQALVPQVNQLRQPSDLLLTENTISYAQMVFNRMECIRHALHTKPTTSVYNTLSASSKLRILCFPFSTNGCHIVLLLTLI